MKYKISCVVLLLGSLVQASDIVQYGSKLIQPLLNPQNYVNFTKNSFVTTIKLAPGYIAGNALNENNKQSSNFNDLIEKLHKENKNPLCSFLKEEGYYPLTSTASFVKLGISACISPKTTIIYGLNKIFLYTFESMMFLMCFLPSFKDHKDDNIEKRVAKLLTRTSISLFKSFLETMHFILRAPQTVVSKGVVRLLGEHRLNQESTTLPWQGYAILLLGITATGVQSEYFKKILELCPLTRKLIDFPEKNLFALVHEQHNT